MRYARHLILFLRDLWGFARENKAWWLLPTVGVLLVLALFIVVSSNTAPLIYALF